MKYLVFTFMTAYGLVSHAQDAFSRRVADLDVGTQVAINLADAEFVEKLEKIWQTSDPQASQNCSLRISSHFDKDLALKSGLTIYTLTQNNPENTQDDRGVHDQFTLWFSTEDKSLPLIGFACSASARNGADIGKGWTLDSVSNLIQQPGFFKTPVYKKAISKLSSEFFPKITAVKILKPLRFTQAKRDRNGGAIVTGPVFEDGRISESTGFCSAYYADAGGHDEGYDITLQPGDRFEFLGSSSGDGNSYNLDFVLPQRARFSLTCSYYWTGIDSFDFFTRHVNSILEFIY
jgi:hypothetical protein